MSEQGDQTITEIISELSEVFAFGRTRWQKFAAEVEPELTGADFILLSSINRTQPVSAKQLTCTLAMDKAAVSRSLSKLRDMGLVSTEASADDGRVQLLSVTPKADAQLRAIREKWAHSYHERFADWDGPSLESLRDNLRRFNEAGR